MTLPSSDEAPSGQPDSTRQDNWACECGQFHHADLERARERVAKLESLEAIITVEKHARDGGFQDSGLLSVGQALISRAARIAELESSLASERSARERLEAAGHAIVEFCEGEEAGEATFITTNGYAPLKALIDHWKAVAAPSLGDHKV